MRVCISSGHGTKIRGAAGSPIPPYLDEVDEAIRCLGQIGNELTAMGVDVETYTDTVSTSVNANLDRIVDWHNGQGAHDLDISIHFNSATFSGSDHTSNPVGTEVFYTSSSGKEWAKRLVDAIANAGGLKNRGAKDDDTIGGLYFLSNTAEVAVLLEICFVNSSADASLYKSKFVPICRAIAETIAGKDAGDIEPPPEPPDGVLFSAEGTCSWFGGPADTGVSPSEGLAMWYEPEECPWLMLEDQPPNTTGMARRLDSAVFYVACRWDYDVTPKEMLRGPQMALVTNTDTGVQRLAHIADWGPHEEQTGRAADLSPGLMDNLGLDTDDEVTVIYPYR